MTARELIALIEDAVAGEMNTPVVIAPNEDEDYNLVIAEVKFDVDKVRLVMGEEA